MKDVKLLLLSLCLAYQFNKIQCRGYATGAAGQPVGCTGVCCDGTAGGGSCGAGYFKTYQQDYSCLNGPGCAYNPLCDCTQCPVGKYKEGSNENTGCDNCPAGKFGPNTGAISSSLCFQCGKGTYSTAVGATSVATCANCAAGKYSNGFSRTSCSQCAAGEYSGAGAIICSQCAAGKYSVGGVSCSNCAVGKYSTTVAATSSSTCQSCARNTYNDVTARTSCASCAVGTYSDHQSSSLSDCLQCVSGKYRNVDWITGDSNACWDCIVCDPGQTMLQCDNTQEGAEIDNGICVTCEAGRYLDPSDGECKLCATGKYQDQIAGFDVLNCLDCDPANGGSDLATQAHRQTTALTGSTREFDCICITVEVDINDGGSGGSGIQLQKWEGQCVCGPGFVMQFASSGGIPICEHSLVNTFQNKMHATSHQESIPCPGGSTSPAGSTSGDDCICNSIFQRQNVDAATSSTLFQCACPNGAYRSGEICVLCEDCPIGFYRVDCELESAGTCKACDACAVDDGEELLRVNCGRNINGNFEGECKPKSLLVRTPLCPDVDGVQQGLAGYTFEQVFGLNENTVDFQCREICDGKNNFDTGVCNGPFACNIKTCVQKMGIDVQVQGALPAVQACPVIIHTEDSESEVEQKRRTQCQDCNVCEGPGCARECSQLLCVRSDENENGGKIFDWTDRTCKPCDELRDSRLCTNVDIIQYDLSSKVVTGNMPLLRFPSCKGGGTELSKIQYGSCEVCNFEIELRNRVNEQVCFSDHTYIESCMDNAPVCGTCLRSQNQDVVNIRIEHWYNNTNQQVLYCQMTSCNDASKTGVAHHGSMCFEDCKRENEDLKCDESQVYVGCTLPHNSRCEQKYPLDQDVQKGLFVTYIGDSINLLNELESNLNGKPSIRFASFENTLISLKDFVDVDLEYQCVWNSDGILDNFAHPAGTSHILWPPKQAYASQFGIRGTKACKPWPKQEHLNVGNVAYPLLPLQNTIQALEDPNFIVRRVLVNSEAHVVSYRFPGKFHDVNIGTNYCLNELPCETSVIGEFTDRYTHAPIDDSTKSMLQNAHTGGAGRLFLMLSVMELNTARLTIHVPNDRNLRDSSWLTGLILNFALVALNQDKTVRFNANIQLNELQSTSRVQSSISLNLWTALMSGNQHTVFRMNSELESYLSNVHNVGVFGNVWARPSLDFSGTSQLGPACDGVYTEDLSMWYSKTYPLFRIVTSSSLTSSVSSTSISSSNVMEPQHVQLKCITMPLTACFSQSRLLIRQEGFVVSTETIDTHNQAIHNVDYLLATGTSSIEPILSALAELSSVNPNLIGINMRQDESFTFVYNHHISDDSADSADSADSESTFVEQINANHMLQAHAIYSFGSCAAVMASQQNIFCVGSSRIQKVFDMKSQLLKTSAKVSCVFDLHIESTGFKNFIIFGLTSSHARSTRLHAIVPNAADASNQEFNIIRLGDVSNTGIAFSWISCSSYQQELTALEFTDTDLLKVSFYKVVVQEDNEDNEDNEDVFNNIKVRRLKFSTLLPNFAKFNVLTLENNNEWYRFCRLSVVEFGTSWIAACVEKKISEEDGIHSRLYVCSGQRQKNDAPVCADIKIAEESDTTFSNSPSFISILFIGSVTSETTGQKDMKYVIRHLNMNFEFLLFAGLRATLHHTEYLSTERLLSTAVPLVQVGPLVYFANNKLQTGRFGIMTKLLGFTEVVINDGNPKTAYAVLIDARNEHVKSNAMLTIHRAHYVKHDTKSVLYEPTHSYETGLLKHLSGTQHDYFIRWNTEFDSLGIGTQNSIALLGIPSQYGKYECDQDLGSNCIHKFIRTVADSNSNMLLTIALPSLTDADVNIKVLLLKLSIGCGRRLVIQNKNQLGACTSLQIDIDYTQSFFSCDENKNMDVILLVYDNIVYMYYFDATIHQMQEKSLLVSSGCCILMQQDVFVTHAENLTAVPASYVISSYLDYERIYNSLSFERWTSVENAGFWQRHRRVYTGELQENMIINMNFENRDSSMINVGIDDIQLLPMISTFPPMSVSEGKLQSYLRIPSAEELTTLDLQHLHRSSSWNRLHTTVALHVENVLAEFCAYSISFSFVDDSALSLDSHQLDELGCILELSSSNVKGVYSECQIEIPSFINSGLNVIQWIIIHASPRNTENAYCFLNETDTLTAFLRPNVALYECDGAHYMHRDGHCVSCIVPNTDFSAQCPPNQRLRGCPALEIYDANNCVNCVSGFDEVNAGRAHYYANQYESCSWQCNHAYYEHSVEGVKSCVLCTNETACEVGFYWQSCAANQDAGCVACESKTNLIERKKFYARNEEYVNASNTCQSTCKTGFYYEFDTTYNEFLCKECWRTEDVLQQAFSDNAGFVEIIPCTTSLNTHYTSCIYKEGSTVVGTDGQTGKCIRECASGFYKNESDCSACPPLQSVQSVFQELLPLDSYAWIEPGSCMFECNATLHYIHTSSRPNSFNNDTCVRCDPSTCENGFYLTGSLCDRCQQCNKSPTEFLRSDSAVTAPTVAAPVVAAPAVAAPTVAESSVPAY